VQFIQFSNKLDSFYSIYSTDTTMMSQQYVDVTFAPVCESVNQQMLAQQPTSNMVGQQVLFISSPQFDIQPTFNNQFSNQSDFNTLPSIQQPVQPMQPCVQMPLPMQTVNSMSPQTLPPLPPSPLFFPMQPFPAQQMIPPQPLNMFPGTMQNLVPVNYQAVQPTMNGSPTMYTQPLLPMFVDNTTPVQANAFPPQLTVSSDDSLSSLESDNFGGNVEEPEEKLNVSTQHGYRSKQRQINKQRAEIKRRYLSIFAGDQEMVRGMDTLRFHVKSFRALVNISKFLNDVENDQRIRIVRVAAPFSKKNKDQKKGFILYLKLENVQQREWVEQIFKVHESKLSGCKCKIAYPSKRALKAQREQEQRVEEKLNLQEEQIVFEEEKPEALFEELSLMRISSMGTLGC